MLGAGCSHEPPTSLPLGAELAQQCHDKLVADGILPPGACQDPTDLPALAELVMEVTGHQQALVDRFPRGRFLSPEPNVGYRLAAALMVEGEVATILTLNFDRAAAIALGNIGAEDRVTVIDGPDDLAHLSAANLVFLHRSIQTPNADDLVLRMDQLEETWPLYRWERFAAQRLLGGTVTVFVGLGSPTPVLTQTVRNIVSLLGANALIYAVDPAGDTAFMRELPAQATPCIQMGWSEFVQALERRLLMEHQNALQDAAGTLIRENNWAAEDVPLVCERLVGHGLLVLGELRARWLMRPGSYLPHPTDAAVVRLLADLVVGVAMLSRLSGCVIHHFDRSGVVEFETPQGARRSLLVLSGEGSRPWQSVQGEVDARMPGLRQIGQHVVGTLVAGIRGYSRATVTPEDIVDGHNGVDDEDIVQGHTPMTIDVDDVRQHPELAKEILL